VKHSYNLVDLTDAKVFALAFQYAGVLDVSDHAAHRKKADLLELGLWKRGTCAYVAAEETGSSASALRIQSLNEDETVN